MPFALLSHRYTINAFMRVALSCKPTADGDPSGLVAVEIWTTEPQSKPAIMEAKHPDESAIYSASTNESRPGSARLTFGCEGRKLTTGPVDVPFSTFMSIRT
jgi:hypothetical protein